MTAFITAEQWRAWTGVDPRPWEPGDPLPGYAPPRIPPDTDEPHLQQCRGNDCWHAKGPGIAPPHTMRWTPGDPIARFDTPSDPAVTRPDQPGERRSSDRHEEGEPCTHA